MNHATRRGNATFGVLLVLIGVTIAILNAVAFHPGAGTQWTKRTEHVHTLEDGSEVRWTEHEAVSVKEGREMAALEQDAALDIRQKNLDTEIKILDLDKESEYARL
ncbi:MAG: hypothetical protein VXW42_03750, partial [Planctomycetota bacterium]|nr:hypothetical protein [Planctomycetota bacterium]